MSENVYLDALVRVEKGTTRSFAELARLAGRPAAARAAGRVVSAVDASDRRPWHRVVASDGRLSTDPERAAVQLERLRKDGARPRNGETIARWARRVGATLVGCWRSGTALAADDPRVEDLDPTRVERLASPAEARSRGFSARRESRSRRPSAARRSSTDAVADSTEDGTRRSR